MNTKAEKVVQKMLFEYADEKYKNFMIKSLATVDADKIIGVRTPNLIKVDKEFLNSEYKDAFLQSLPHKYYEENQVHGYLITREKDRNKVFKLLDEFLPYVDNWATCDTFKPRVFDKNPPEIEKLRQWMKSEETYICRYGVGLLMGYYLDDLFKEEYLDDVVAIKSNEYYVNMMRAWFFATAIAKQYERTLPYIEKQKLDIRTHNKSIQKAKESFRVPDENKKYLDSLRIKNTDFTIRNATAKDEDKILALYQSVIGSKFCVWNDDYPTMQEIKEDISNKNLFLLIYKKKIVGSLSIVSNNELDEAVKWTIKDKCSEIARIVIAPKYQGSDLSKKLVSYACDVIKSRKQKAVHLIVEVNNIPAQKIYEKCGFAVVGKCKMFGHTYFACEKNYK